MAAVARISSADEAIEAAKALARTWSATIVETERAPNVPFAELDALRHSGLLAISVPSEYGGAGVSWLTIVSVFRILGQADGGLAQVPQNHFDFVDVVANADEETRRFFYELVLNGGRFGNALAEKGQRGGNLATTLIEVDGGYLLNGDKAYATGALTADYVPVASRHPDGRNLTAFVERNADGLTVERDWNAFGQRVTFSGSVRLRNVWVPEAHVLDRSRTGPLRSSVLTAGNQAIHAAIEVGVGEAGLRAAVEAAGAQSLTAVSELVADLAAAWATVAHAARRIDEALASDSLEDAIAAHMAVEEAKGVCYETGPRILTEALRLLPRARLDAERSLDRFWRNSRTHSLHDPARWRRYYVGDYVLNGRLDSMRHFQRHALGVKPAPEVPLLDGPAARS